MMASPSATSRVLLVALLVSSECTAGGSADLGSRECCGPDSQLAHPWPRRPVLGLTGRAVGTRAVDTWAVASEQQCSTLSAGLNSSCVAFSRVITRMQCLPCFTLQADPVCPTLTPLAACLRLCAGVAAKCKPWTEGWEGCEKCSKDGKRCVPLLLPAPPQARHCGIPGLVLLREVWAPACWADEAPALHSPRFQLLEGSRQGEGVGRGGQSGLNLT